LGEAQKSGDEQPDIGVMVAHDLAGAATFSRIEGAPPTDEVDALWGDSPGAGFRGSAAAKRTADAIGVVDRRRQGSRMVVIPEYAEDGLASRV